MILSDKFDWIQSTCVIIWTWSLSWNSNWSSSPRLKMFFQCIAEIYFVVVPVVALFMSQQLLSRVIRKRESLRPVLWQQLIFYICSRSRLIWSLWAEIASSILVILNVITRYNINQYLHLVTFTEYLIIQICWWSGVDTKKNVFLFNFKNTRLDRFDFTKEL